jgi:NTP pyrophosphatase (non-canonical NTP hydrolase)
MKDLCLKSPLLDGLIARENLRQLKKWGVQDRHPFEWLAYATEELGELARAISEHVYRNGPGCNIVKEAIQTATLSLKIAEMFLEALRKEERVTFIEKSQNQNPSPLAGEEG